MSDLPERDDAEALIAPRIERWEHASWDDLDRLEANEVEEQTIGPSGQCYRVRSYAFWDTEPWESELYVWVKVYGNRGWRKWWPYPGSLSRGGPSEIDGPDDDPIPDGVPGSRWVKRDGRWQLRD